MHPGTVVGGEGLFVVDGGGGGVVVGECDVLWVVGGISTVVLDGVSVLVSVEKAQAKSAIAT